MTKEQQSAYDGAILALDEVKKQGGSFTALAKIVADTINDGRIAEGQTHPLVLHAMRACHLASYQQGKKMAYDAIELFISNAKDHDNLKK